jgi:hypothetical protein
MIIVGEPFIRAAVEHWRPQVPPTTIIQFVRFLA